MTRWAASILPGENSILRTREPWCEGPVNRNTHHGAKQFAERRSKQHARLTRVGRKAEVLVAEQRDWYVGKIVPNHFDGASPTTNLLAVRFSNGSVLLNVRPSELRQVPRTTVVYWILIALIWATCALTLCLNVPAAAHAIRNGPLGEVWLFPDRAFEHLPNTTLYNLTYSEVAAAHAHPETWLSTVLHDKVEQYRLSSIAHWFRYTQFRTLEGDAGLIVLLLPIIMAFGAAMPLRGIPLPLLLTGLVSVTLTVAAERLCELTAYRWPEKYPRDELGQLVQQNIAHFVVLIFFHQCGIGLLSWFGFPHPLFSWLRRRGLARSVSRAFMWTFVATFVYSVLMLLRMFHFTTILDDVVTTDKTLERFAFSILYMESSHRYLSFHITLGYPMLGVVLYILMQLELACWAQVLMSLAVVLLAPLALWTFVVVKPLPPFAPATWELVNKELPTAQVAKDILDYLVYLTITLVMFIPVVVVIVHAVVVAHRVSRLGARVRAALGIWASRSLIASCAPPPNAPQAAQTQALSRVSDYEPLSQRAPSRDVIRPCAVYFESYFALPSAKLRHTITVPGCLRLLLSTSTQVQRVLAATGVMLAGYMAHVVAGSGDGQRQVLRETLEEVCESIDVYVCVVGGRTLRSVLVPISLSPLLASLTVRSP